MSRKLKRRGAVALGVAVVASLVVAIPALAATFYVNYTGQGFTADGSGGYIINDERCGLEGQAIANDGGTGQFANWDGTGDPYDTGDPYLVWVLTANGATSAKLHLPDKTVDMINVGGTWKFASGWYDPATLSPGNSSTNTPVYAEYVKNGSVRNVQLTVSHGCAPHQATAWCSPGFWKNTLNFNPNAWNTIGVDPTTAMFNGNVSPDYYANDLSADQLLTYVLNHPGDYGGALGTAGPYDLTAFNAVGAYLTDQIPGYQFDPSLVGSDDACPVDAHGQLK
jgi:hypothetical protein